MRFLKQARYVLVLILFALFGLASFSQSIKNKQNTKVLGEQVEHELEHQLIEFESDHSGCVIKGNISDRGKLYHLPNCSSYDLTKISEEKNEKWFCTEEEALEAGWVKSSSCE